MGVSTTDQYFIFNTNSKVALEFQIIIPHCSLPVPILHSDHLDKTYSGIPVMMKEETEDKGMVLIKNLSAVQGEEDSWLILAHKNQIEKMVFTNDLKYIVIAAINSNVIRVFRVEDQSLFKTLKKWICQGPISSLSVDVNFLNDPKGENAEAQRSNFVLVSDKEGNLEVFYLEAENSFDVVDGRI
jgi:hypothetical protein